MTVRIVAFARIREVLGTAERALTLPEGARARDAWAALAVESPALDALLSSTRLARNGRVVAGDEALQDGDEVALLPPAGGG
ncbi:MAG TPA: MoaD/ThiS family protein [Candidatus Tyrphobacter sp.]